MAQFVSFSSLLDGLTLPQIAIFFPLIVDNTGTTLCIHGIFLSIIPKCSHLEENHCGFRVLQQLRIYSAHKVSSVRQYVVYHSSAPLCRCRRTSADSQPMNGALAAVIEAQPDDICLCKPFQCRNQIHSAGAPVSLMISLQKQQCIVPETAPN